MTRLQKARRGLPLFFMAQLLTFFPSLITLGNPPLPPPQISSSWGTYRTSMTCSPVARVQVPGQLYFQVLPCQQKFFLVQLYPVIYTVYHSACSRWKTVFTYLYFWHSSSSLLLWPFPLQVLMEAWEKGVNPEGNSTNPSNWDFSNSFFFAGTVVTTIGEVLSFLKNWGFLQLSCKAPRNV